jgi:hypothetical protein
MTLSSAARENTKTEKPEKAEDDRQVLSACAD